MLRKLVLFGNQVLSKLMDVFGIWIGVLQVSFLIYLYLILVRTPRDLDVPMSIYYAILYCIIFLLSIGGFVSALKEIYNIPFLSTVSNSIFGNKIVYLYGIFWKKGLESLDKFIKYKILSKIFDFDKFMVRLNVFLAFRITIRMMEKMVFWVEIMPRVVVATSFFIHCFFFDQIHFKFLPLLFISLIFTYVFYSFFSHSVIRLRELEDKLTITQLNPAKMVTPMEYTVLKANIEFFHAYGIVPEFDYSNYNWNFTREYFNKLKALDNGMAIKERQQKYLIPLIERIVHELSPMYFFYDVKFTCFKTYSAFWNIVVSALFMISWGYVVLRILFL